MAKKTKSKKKGSPPEKKEKEISATPRQKKVIELILENTGKSKGEILKQAGYPRGTQVNPHQVFQSKALKDFFAKDGKGIQALQDKHNELLNSTEIRRVSVPFQLSDEEIHFFFETEFPGSKILRILDDARGEYFREKVVMLRVPNDKLQVVALDMAYKVLGLYKDPNALTPPPKPNQSEEKTLRLSRAEQLFQLGTPKS